MRRTCGGVAIKLSRAARTSRESWIRATLLTRPPPNANGRRRKAPPNQATVTGTVTGLTRATPSVEGRNPARRKGRRPTDSGRRSRCGACGPWLVTSASGRPGIMAVGIMTGAQGARWSGTGGRRYATERCAIFAPVASREDARERVQNKSKYSLCSHTVTSLAPLDSALKRASSASFRWA